MRILVILALVLLSVSRPFEEQTRNVCRKTYPAKMRPSHCKSQSEDYKSIDRSDHHSPTNLAILNHCSNAFINSVFNSESVSRANSQGKTGYNDGENIVCIFYTTEDPWRKWITNGFKRVLQSLSIIVANLPLPIFCRRIEMATSTLTSSR